MGGQTYVFALIKYYYIPASSIQDSTACILQSSFFTFQ